MKIRKAIRMAALGTAALALPHVASAAMGPNMTPMGEGLWTIGASGEINAGCDTAGGWTCSSATVTDTGFLQRQVTDGTNTFIQTIVAEGASGGNFANYTTQTSFFGDESFVAVGSSTGGVYGRQRLSDQTTGLGNFTAQVNLNTGEFMQMENVSEAKTGGIGNGSMVELGQQIDDAANEFNATFAFDHGMIMSSANDNLGMAKFVNLTLTSYANDTARGFDSSFNQQRLNFEGMTIGTSLENEEYKRMDILSNLSGPNADGITQNFAVRERMGLGLIGGGTWVWDDGTTATYTAGEALKRTTVGQLVDGAGAFGFTNAFSNTIADVVDGAATDDTGDGKSGGVYSLVDAGVPFVSITDDATDPDGDPFNP